MYTTPYVAAVTAAPVSTAAIAAPGTAGAATDTQPFPFEDDPVIRRAELSEQR